MVKNDNRNIKFIRFIIVIIVLAIAYNLGVQQGSISIARQTIQQQKAPILTDSNLQIISVEWDSECNWHNICNWCYKEFNPEKDCYNSWCYKITTNVNLPANYSLGKTCGNIDAVNNPCTHLTCFWYIDGKTLGLNPNRAIGGPTEEWFWWGLDTGLSTTRGVWDIDIRKNHNIGFCCSSNLDDLKNNKFDICKSLTLSKYPCP
ncbi:MAG: hypothetical protein QXD55_01890 [Candidatus Aenigmatarchaeota archaeon]